MSVRSRTSSIPERRRRSWLGLLLLAALVLGIGQIWWTYSPRVRHGRPAVNGMGERLLADGGFEYRVWVAHPHQNLARARSWIGDPEPWLSALAQMAETERSATGPATVPTFGPFAVPPASGLAVGWTSGGEVAITARIRPALVLVSRLAGSVAGNPWLGGGEVELAGRSVRVGWRGRDWVVASDEVWRRLERAPRATVAERPPLAIGLLRYARPLGPMPPGQLALTLGADRSLELASWGMPGEVLSAGSAGRQKLAEVQALVERSAIEFLLVGDARTRAASVDDAAAPVRRPTPEDSEGIAFEDAALEEPVIDGGIRESRDRPVVPPGRSVLALGGAAISAGTIRLPSSAVVRPVGSAARFELPVESLARRLGIDLIEVESGGVTVSSLERGGVALVEPLLPQLGHLLTEREPAWGLWLEPVPLLELASTLRAGFERLPLLGHREAERWGAAEQLLRPLARRGALAATVSTEGAVLVVSYRRVRTDEGTR